MEEATETLNRGKSQVSYSNTSLKIRLIETRPFSSSPRVNIHYLSINSVIMLIMSIMLIMLRHHNKDAVSLTTVSGRKSSGDADAQRVCQEKRGEWRRLPTPIPKEGAIELQKSHNDIPNMSCK